MLCRQHQFISNQKQDPAIAARVYSLLFQAKPLGACKVGGPLFLPNWYGFRLDKRR